MNWYIGEDRSRSVREVVVEVPSPEPIDPKFGMMFMGDSYHILRSNVWVTGLFRMDNDPGPHLMLRSDNHTGILKRQPFRLAFCFYHLRAGGLFALFVDFPEVELPGAPSAPYVLFEMIRGLDHEDERGLIADALKLERLRVCFTEGDGPGENLPGGGWAGGSINAQYDVLAELDAGCRKALRKEWKALLKHHKSVPEDDRDFGMITAQMAEENPTSRNPVIDRGGVGSTGTDSPAQGTDSQGRSAEDMGGGDEAESTPETMPSVRSARKWWEFWK